jgi:ubiquinol-cytochrome c reductase cytochrome b subunit
VVIPGIMTTLLLAYPALERKLTQDKATHNLLQRPRDAPVRTALGMMAITFYLVLLITGGDDVISYKLQLSINAFTWVARIALLLLPPLAYYLTYRICLGLQRYDRDVLSHGIETGIIRRLPHGEFIEIHQPLGAVDDHGHPIPLPYQGATVPQRINQLGLAGKPIPGSLYRPDPSQETAALHAARDGNNE